MNRKQRAEAVRRRDVYLRAAELVQEARDTDMERFSCYAVYAASDKKSSYDSYGEESDSYNALFGGDALQIAIYNECGSAINQEGCRDLRILLLCMAAAMAETGDL